MKNIYALVVLLLVLSQAQAQQRPQYTQYMMNNYLLNPAITGIEDYTDVRLGTRQQWVGLEDAPVTYYISAHMPLNKQAKRVRSVGPNKGLRSTHTVNQNRFVRAYPHHGVGITALTDKTGLLRRNHLNLTYAYHLPVSRKVTVSLGALGGVVKNSFNFSEATYNNPADPAYTKDYINRTYIDLGMGTWVYSDNFFVGISGAQLLRANRDLNRSEDEDTNGVLQKHFFATAGYKIRLTPDINIIPSVMVKLANPSPVSVDASLRAVYADRVWIGGTYRNKDAVAAMAGVNLTTLLDVSYSYDYNTSNLSIANTGTHEVIVGFKLFNKGGVICPQWMH